MSSKPDGAAPRVDAEHRRWLIGIGISVAFGLFGAVMAWLSYEARTGRVTPTVVHVNGPAPAPVSGGSDPAQRRRHSAHDRN